LTVENLFIFYWSSQTSHRFSNLCWFDISNTCFTVTFSLQKRKLVILHWYGLQVKQKQMRKTFVFCKRLCCLTNGVQPTTITVHNLLKMSVCLDGLEVFTLHSHKAETDAWIWNNYWCRFLY